MAVLDITQKVLLLALKYIGPIRQSGFFIMGGQDLFLGAKKTIRRWKHIGRDAKVTRAFCKVLAGSTLIMSGIFGLWSSLDFIKKGFNTSLNHQLFAASNIFFLFSSILRLKTCLDDYLEAKNQPAEISAMMGIGANLYYIIAASLMLFTAPTAFVIILCCVGTATSFLQAIYDFSH